MNVKLTLENLKAITSESSDTTAHLQLLDLEPNTKTMVSVANDDRNFPDMQPETQQRTVIESIVGSHLSFADLLNPAYESEDEDNLVADEQNSASGIDACSLSDPNHPMDIDTAYGEGTKDCSSQADSRMSIEHEVLTIKSGISLAHVCDPLEDRDSNSGPKRLAKHP